LACSAVHDYFRRALAADVWRDYVASDAVVDSSAPCPDGFWPGAVAQDIVVDLDHPVGLADGDGLVEARLSPAIYQPLGAIHCLACSLLELSGLIEREMRADLFYLSSARIFPIFPYYF
jgi:hypothetical protein